MFIGGIAVGTLQYDSDMSVSLPRGKHRVRAVDGKGKSPWHPGQRELEVVIDGDATLTLLPPESPRGGGQ